MAAKITHILYAHLTITFGSIHHVSYVCTPYPLFPQFAPPNTQNAMTYAVPHVYRCAVEDITLCCEEQAVAIFVVEVSGIGRSEFIRTGSEKCGHSNVREGGMRYRLIWDNENGEKETMRAFVLTLKMEPTCSFEMLTTQVSEHRRQ